MNTICNSLPFDIAFKIISFLQGWKLFYVRRHYELATRASVIVKFVEQCSPSASLEARDYLKALGDIRSSQLSFEDVEMFLFKPKRNVLLNLVGLHYCIYQLQVPMKRVMNALECCKIAERQVLVKWWKLGQWQHGFRQRDESHYRMVSMADLATEKHEVLGVLNRGAVYEVMRIQVSVAYPLSGPWTCQSSA
ncbi:hypothetical protein KSS87_018232 [Heliosperma pusillum]|nr:hypothetical protein KSS87_018232 [Heliosperma pusillum]